MKIIATILAQDKKEFKKQYSHIAPYFKYIQIDIMDGEFVKNKTNINPYILKKFLKTHKILFQEIVLQFQNQFPCLLR